MNVKVRTDAIHWWLSTWCDLRSWKVLSSVNKSSPSLLWSSLLCMHAKSLQSCLILYDPMGCSPLGSSVHEILQARILEWVVLPPPGDLLDPGFEPASLMSYALAGGFFFFFFTTSATWGGLCLLELDVYYKLYMPDTLSCSTNMLVLENNFSYHEGIIS